MFRLSGYSLVKEEVYRSENTSVVRGIRKTDDLPVVIKILNREYPTEEELSRFTSEYELTRSLEGPGILKVHDLVPFKKSLAMVTEDMGGISLAESMASFGPDLGEKLALAVAVTEALARIHERKVIHKDMNPRNILYNRENGEIRIIDFGIATELRREIPQKMTPDVLEGTMGYVSPEQTGRMNRPVDSRSDLYSLGMTLYEFFCGRLPYQWQDESEIVYCHIARVPESPKQANPRIPTVLSDIILKLLEKNAEDRYQTAQGLKHDLERCQKSLSPQGEIPAFLIGRNDYFGLFQIPDKLYGREAELARLRSAFDAVAGGESRIAMIEGAAGVGKSSLINELYRSIAEKRGYFVSGKFDQLENNKPLSALMAALSGLVARILAEPGPVLEAWRDRILGELSHNVQVVSDVLPDLEGVVGSQPPALVLPPLEAQNRFLIVLRDFIALFASPESPLVVFLDDLQWTDLATLEFVKYLFAANPVPHVLFIGAYRGNEVPPDHPIALMVGDLERNGPAFLKLPIEPLGEDDVNRLLADTFSCFPEKTAGLAGTVFGKTKGNPFYTGQFLLSLHGRGAFKYSPALGEWSWDQDAIEKMDATQNVLELLAGNIEKLPPRTLDALKIASCIGNHFDLNQISLIKKTFPLEIGRDLWPAVEGEYIYPRDNNYRLLKLQENDRSLATVDIGFTFRHDRIQQLVYALIPEEEKRAIHLEIGRYFFRYTENAEDSDFIFNLADHLNIGSPLIKEKTELLGLKNMNLAAGRKAMRSAAFPSALHYLEKAWAVLGEADWEKIPRERFDLLLDKGEALFLTGNLPEAESLCGLLMAYAESNYDRGLVHKLRARILEFQAHFPEAIEEIRRGVSLFGIDLPGDPDRIQGGIGEGIMKMQQGLDRVPVDEIANVPEMTDRNRILAMELLFQVIPPALQTNPPLFLLSSLLMLDQTLEYGATPVSCKCLCDCAIIQASTLGDFSRGYELGKASFALIRRFKAEALKPAVYFGFTFVSALCEHFQESLDYYDLSYQRGLETGDLQHAAYAVSHKLHLAMHVGTGLAECLGDSDRALAFTERVQSFMPRLLTKLIKHFIVKYRSDPDQDEASDFPGRDRAILSELEALNNLSYVQRFAHYNAFYSYIHRDLEGAEQWDRMAEGLMFAALSDFPVPDHYLIQSLLVIKKWDRLNGEERDRGGRNIMDNLEKLKKWADSCPENFAHKYLFLSAEWSALRGKPLEATMGFYQEALDSMKEQDFAQMRALINEARADFWLKRGDEIIANAYVREAYYWYQTWGALRKTGMMEKEFPRIVGPGEKKRSRGGTSGSRIGSGSLPSDSLDIASILKATQSINGEIRIDRLLENLMAILIENTGAQQGALLLLDGPDNELRLEAEKRADSEGIEVLQSRPYAECPRLSPEIVRYVQNSRDSLVLGNACEEGKFNQSSYVREQRPKSVLCAPVVYQNSLKGIVYLENNLMEGVFTEDRLEVVRILSSHASISIDNARLYENLEERVRERTVQLREANDRLKELSLLDPLTDLHNRRYIQEFVSEISLSFIKNKLRLVNGKDNRDPALQDKIMGVFLIDIDHFKDVNDTFGHAAGDKFLVGVSRILEKMIRADDFLVRWGGEEFLIILNNTKIEYLDDFAKKLLTGIGNASIRVLEDRSIQKTCSVGYTLMPMDPHHPELLNLEQTINISDYALYYAKENRRNRAVCIKAKEASTTSDEGRDYLRRLTKHSTANGDFIDLKVVKSEGE